MAGDGERDAAEHDTLDAAAAVGTHNDAIGLPFGSGLEDQVAGFALLQPRGSAETGGAQFPFGAFEQDFGCPALGGDKMLDCGGIERGHAGVGREQIEGVEEQYFAIGGFVLGFNGFHRDP